MQVRDLSSNIHERIGQILGIAGNVWSDRPIMGKLAAAQAILESRLLGEPSGLAEECNNLFGMKGRGSAGTSMMGTKEFINGREITVNAGFASYKDINDSFMAHRELMYKPRYADVLKARSPHEAATEVWKAGYATDPNYPAKLIDIMDEYL